MTDLLILLAGFSACGLLGYALGEQTTYNNCDYRSEDLFSTLSPRNFIRYGIARTLIENAQYRASKRR